MIVHLSQIYKTLCIKKLSIIDHCQRFGQPKLKPKVRHFYEMKKDFGTTGFDVNLTSYAGIPIEILGS